jgi:hypothetical protein
MRAAVVCTSGASHATSFRPRRGPRPRALRRGRLGRPLRHRSRGAEGESVFTDATPVDLGSGLIPAYPPLPAAIGLQRLTIAPGGHVDTPGDDPRLVFFTVEQGTLTVRNTVPAVVTRASQHQETLPANTDFTMGPGDSTVSGPESGGTLRNEGTGDVTLLAAILWPVRPSTPVPAATAAA